MEPSRTISRTIFGGVVLALFLTLTIAECAGWFAIERALGRRLNGGVLAALFLPNLVLSRIAADRISRRLGLSRSGKALEVRGRSTVLPEGVAPDDEVVEVHVPRSHIRAGLVFSLMMCLVAVALLMYGPHSSWERMIFWVCLAVFGPLFVHFWWDGPNPQARVDARGVLGYPWGSHFRRRFVPWSEVATCEIETYHDTFGAPGLIRPVLKDSAGRELLTLNLLGARLEDQERLMKCIRARLPKTHEDFGE